MDKRIADIENLINEAESPRVANVIAQIKGSGKLLSKVIAAEFGDIDRFEKSPKSGRTSGMYKRMLAFAGCEPRIRESGKWRGRVRMSKRGSGALRTALMQIAFTISQNDDFFKSIYEKHISAHQHHKVALSYVAATGCSGLSQRDHEVSTSVWAVGASATLTLLPDMCTEGVWAFEPVSGNFAAPCALTVASDAGTANFAVKYYKPE